MQKKFSMFPIFAADALMFLAVFLIALPNIFLKEPLEAGQTFALAAVVLIAMFMVLVPIVLSARKRNSEDVDLKSSKEIRQIFADLRTLRDALMEQIKKIDIAGEEIERLDALSKSLEAELAELKESGELKFEEELKSLNLSISALKSDFANIAQKSNCSEEIELLRGKIETLSEKSEGKFQILDDICEQLQNIADSFAEETKELEETSEESSSEENQDKIEEETEQPEEPNKETAEEEQELQVADEKSGGFDDEDFGKDDNLEEEMEDPEDEEPISEDYETPKSEAKGNPKWAGMLDKAFQNSQSFSTRKTVSRFIEKNRQGNAPEESNGVEVPLEKQNASDTASSISMEDLEKTETYSEVSEGVSRYEEKIAREDTLFPEEELPQAHKPQQIKSGDTAVVVNAFLGIGNTPCIRGNGAGLSQEKGTAMDLLEIGKYQWKCEGIISEPVKISIWLNDKIPSNLGELTLNPNETLDIDPTFE
ncbi:hypothetical protein [Intestinicryptomonas porci]|uniref:Uncharacterized protein n=1 Tax=Intestinicryptomonas porci TaxID=2926320 RepID=A0ABU4WDU1_9BACT|nr:hypothetical protein [Opitutales bacterium CLA-KB-P66]